MNTVLLNTFSLDGETVIKKGSGGGGGGIPINNQSKSVEFTENGTSEVRYDAGYTGLEKVSVKVAIPTESKSVTITENGSSEVSASKGYLDKVSINVAIPTEEKTVDITENGTTEVVAANGFLSKVVVNTNVQSGGGNTPAPSKGVVNFIDYDGTILHSYTKDEFLALTEMPALPTQKGLTCQGWNWSLGDAKAYVEQYGTIDVGATYITDDGKTRLYITIVAEGRMEVPLALKQSVANGVVIDWGDGSATETFSGTSSTTLRHTYGKVGDYIITFEVLNGTLSLEGTSSYGIFADSIRAYGNMLQKVEIGNNVTSIGSYTFNVCSSLASVVIPNGVTSIGSTAFGNCYSLASVVIPNGVTSIGGAFYNCSSLASVVIPNGVTRIENGTFDNCSSLASVVIPNDVTSIGSSAFSGCYPLASVVIPNGVTSIGSSAFSGCRSLASVVIPNGVTSIGSSAFSGCSSLVSVVIPNGLTTIEGGAFGSCSSLVSVVIPNGVTSIGSSAFNNGYSIAILDFRTHTSVPTLSSTNAFKNIPSDCKIVIPDSLYDTWMAATNWSTYASNIVKASEFNG